MLHDTYGDNRPCMTRIVVLAASSRMHATCVPAASAFRFVIADAAANQHLSVHEVSLYHHVIILPVGNISYGCWTATEWAERCKPAGKGHKGSLL